MGESIWKKEIHLRKPKQQPAEPAVAPEPVTQQPESTSVWKKELHLRKPKQQPAEPAVASEPATQQPESTSVWKKELHLRKQREPLPPFPSHLIEKQRAPQRPRGTVVVPVIPVVPEADPVERVDRWTARVPAPRTQFPRPAVREDGEEPVALIPREEPAPVPELPRPTAPYGWSQPAAPVDETPAQPPPPVEDPPASVAPPTRMEDALAAFTPAAAAEEVSDTNVSDARVEETPPFVPAPTRMEDALAAFTPAAAAEEVSDTNVSDARVEETPPFVPAPTRMDDALAAFEEPPTLVPTSTPMEDALAAFTPAPAVEEVSDTNVSDTRVEETPPFVPAPTRMDDALAAFEEPPALVPTSTPMEDALAAFTPAPSVEEVLEEPEPDRSSAMEAAFAAFADPAPATEAPPTLVVEEPEPLPVEEKVPLLKREISFSRKSKAPKEPKPKKQPKAKKEPKPAAEEKVPLLKREISLRRKAKVVAPVAVAAAESAAPKEKVPLLKREISLGRKPKTKSSQAAASGDKVTRVVGLRIGASQISAAHIENNGSAHLVQLARKPIEHGLVVAGEVREPVALTKALKSFFAANKLPRKDIRLGIASNRIGVRVLEVPSVDDAKQFENAVRFRAQEVLPIPVVDAVLDWVTLSEQANPDGEAVRRILLVFAHRELVNRYVDVCKQAGLRLTAIDLDAFALLRAVASAPSLDGPKHAVVAVSVGHERTVFAVSDGDVCEFTRVLEWGSGMIDVAIARALNLTPSQAEPIKQAFVLEAEEPPAGLSALQYEAVRSAVKSEIAVLVRELVSSLRFYQSQPNSLALGEVLLAGGGAELDGFAAELERGLGARVRHADPFQRVTFAKKLSAPEAAGSLAIAVGLGIEG